MFGETHGVMTSAGNRRIRRNQTVGRSSTFFIHYFLELPLYLAEDERFPVFGQCRCSAAEHKRQLCGPTCSLTVAAACKEEEESLRNENENLKKDVNNLKNRLIAAETKNGGEKSPRV